MVLVLLSLLPFFSFGRGFLGENDGGGVGRLFPFSLSLAHHVYYFYS